jgi:ABC-type polysaccharide/polyol phosphate transport system ATPase subunit
MNMLTESDSYSGISTNSNEPVIKLENVSVRYRVPRERVSGIKEYTIQWLKRRLIYEEFWALEGVSLNVARGEVFGVIGQNGSGKSTLLKVIARVLVPTKGRVVLRGQVAPLLELGAGFHMELTGMENIFLNSALLGRTRKEVEQLLPEIIEFAEIGDFINAPMRTYSTGMVVRLGFSVATCWRPQILLVDEVLSVGDARFQRKCLDRIYSYQEQGTTVVMVSHSMATIESFCDRALWLKAGRIGAMGAVSEVVKRFVQDMRGNGEDQTKYSKDARAASDTTTYHYHSLPKIEGIYPVDRMFKMQEGTISVWMKFDSSRPFKDAVIFHTEDSRFVLYTGSYFSSELDRDLRVIVARAGGNRRVIDTYYGLSNFPEVSVTLDLEEKIPDQVFPYDQWRLVTMTWYGYPEGRLALYINGMLMGELVYDRRYDNGQSAAHHFAVGMRPPEWQGEVVQNEDGTMMDVRPETTLSVKDSNIEIMDLRLYQTELSQEEIQILAAKRITA